MYFSNRRCARFLPPQIPLIDGNLGTARQLQKRLAQANLRGAAIEADIMNRIEFHSSKPGAETIARMRSLFQTALDQLSDK